MPLPGLPTGGAPPPDERLWTLTKDNRTAICWQRRHPLGLQLRVDVNGDTMRTTVARDPEEAAVESTRMRDLMIGRGWK